MTTRVKPMQSQFMLLTAKLESLSDDGVKQTSGIPGLAFAIEWNSGVLISARSFPTLLVCARVTNMKIAEKYMEQWDQPKEHCPDMGFFLDEDMDTSVIELNNAGSLETMLAQVDKLNEIRLAIGTL
jgi:hypothetical protein